MCGSRVRGKSLIIDENRIKYYEKQIHGYVLKVNRGYQLALEGNPSLQIRVKLVPENTFTDPQAIKHKYTREQ